jgi:phosphatidate cytidylyltransferase
MVMVSVLSVTLPGFALGAAGMWLGTRNASRAEAGRRWRKLVMFFLIVHGLVACAAAGRWAVAVAALALLGFAADELSRAWRLIEPPRPSRIWVVFAVAGAGVVHATLYAEPGQVLYVFLSVAACDGFSQVVGQWIGKTPLAPVVSPTKTLEGFAGGLVASIGVAVLLRSLVPVSAGGAVIAGAGIAVSGLAGDLAASWVKRRAGLKDFGSRLPGQGGVLDRFDSFIAAVSVAALAIRLAGA